MGMRKRFEGKNKDYAEKKETGLTGGRFRGDFYLKEKGYIEEEATKKIVSCKEGSDGVTRGC